MPRNPKLEARAERLRRRAEKLWRERDQAVRLYSDFFYKARSWSGPPDRGQVRVQPRSAPTSASWSPTGLAPQTRFSPGTSNAARPRTSSKSSSTMSRPTACPAPPTAPMLFACSAMRSPTICWCCFAPACLRPLSSPRPPSSSSACACSSLARGCAARAGACGSISPAVGPGGRCLIGSWSVSPQSARLEAQPRTPVRDLS